MSNMGYCRFENTYKDLSDCWINWDSDLSTEEAEAKEKMLELCKKIAEEN